MLERSFRSICLLAVLSALASFAQEIEPVPSWYRDRPLPPPGANYFFVAEIGVGESEEAAKENAWQAAIRNSARGAGFTTIGEDGREERVLTNNMRRMTRCITTLRISQDNYKVYMLFKIQRRVGGADDLDDGNDGVICEDANFEKEIRAFNERARQAESVLDNTRININQAKKLIQAGNRRDVLKILKESQTQTESLRRFSHLSERINELLEEIIVIRNEIGRDRKLLGVSYAGEYFSVIKDTIETKRPFGLMVEFGKITKEGAILSIDRIAFFELNMFWNKSDNSFKPSSTKPTSIYGGTNIGWDFFRESQRFNLIAGVGLGFGVSDFRSATYEYSYLENGNFKEKEAKLKSYSLTFGGFSLKPELEIGKHGINILGIPLKVLFGIHHFSNDDIFIGSESNDLSVSFRSGITWTILF